MSALPTEPTEPTGSTGPTAPTTAAGPLVVVCLRITDLRPEVEPLSGAITRDPWSTGLSAADAAALEHALRVAEAWSGRVVAVAVGPPAVEAALRDVAALGAQVVRIPSPGGESDADSTAAGSGYIEELATDEQELARTIASVVQGYGEPTLVLCGDRSADRGTGALPAFLAHELGASQALGLVTLETEGSEPDRDDGSTGMSLIVERRLDAGWRERLRVPVPAVCSVEGAGVTVRRASLPAALEAGTLAIPVVRSPADRRPGVEPAAVRVGSSSPYTPPPRVLPAPASDDPRIRLLELTGALVAHDPPTIVGPVGAVEAADALLAFLARHDYLDQVPAADSDPGSSR
jgi:electron transfer flavoprotein beta subunit